MTELEVLRNDIKSMSYEEALDHLKFVLDMMKFEPLTGEIKSLHDMKQNNNNHNYSVYVAINKCIELIESKIQESK